jgi:hypothetical protein
VGLRFAGPTLRFFLGQLEKLTGPAASSSSLAAAIQIHYTWVVILLARSVSLWLV